VARLSVRQQMFVQTYVASSETECFDDMCVRDSSKENTRIFSYELIKQSTS